MEAADQDWCFHTRCGMCGPWSHWIAANAWQSWHGGLRSLFWGDEDHSCPFVNYARDLCWPPLASHSKDADLGVRGNAGSCLSQKNAHFLFLDNSTATAIDIYILSIWGLTLSSSWGIAGVACLMTCLTTTGWILLCTVLLFVFIV